MTKLVYLRGPRVELPGQGDLASLLVPHQPYVNHLEQVKKKAVRGNTISYSIDDLKILSRNNYVIFTYTFYLKRLSIEPSKFFFDQEFEVLRIARNLFSLLKQTH